MKAATANSDVVLHLDGVWKSYVSGAVPVPALRGVDLAVQQGEFLAVMGPSGCGKSTLLHIAAGLDTPDEGCVSVAGQRIDRLSARGSAVSRRSHVGLVFQFFELLDSMSARENVALAALLGGAKRATAERRATDLLDVMGLRDRAEDLPAVLSGGQRQRLAIARALANDPTLLLADEPTGALDSEGTAQIIDLMRLLHGGGQTIVVVTHDACVASAASRVVDMRDGRVHERVSGGVP